MKMASWMTQLRFGAEGEAPPGDYGRLSLDEIDCALLFGVGTGEGAHQLLLWLNADPHRRLFFIEEDIALVRGWLRSDVGYSLAHHPQATLHCGELPDEAYAGLLAEEIGERRFELMASERNLKERGERFQRLKGALLLGIAGERSLRKELLSQDNPFFSHLPQNIPHLATSGLASSLFGSFQGVGAIICGAGASLNDSFAQLSLLEERALIFAGGSALTAMSRGGLLPHFGGGIDPTIQHYERSLRGDYFELPYFYRHRIHPGILEAIQGPKLYVDGAPGYPLQGWIDERLGIEGSGVEEGCSVTCFLASLAFRLGCSPILFVGVDLAFTGGVEYARGVDGAKNPAEGVIASLDVKGLPTFTAAKWLLESSWLAAFAKEHPECVWLNATGAGIGIPGVRAIDLADAGDLLQRALPLRSLVAAELQAVARPVASPGLIAHILDEIRESAYRTEVALEVLIAEGGGSASGVVAQVELYDEPIYEHFLAPMMPSGTPIDHLMELKRWQQRSTLFKRVS